MTWEKYACKIDFLEIISFAAIISSFILHGKISYTDEIFMKTIKLIEAPAKLVSCRHRTRV